MNILFMNINRIDNIDQRSIYCDLLRCFRDHGHRVYVISPNEKRLGLPTQYREVNGAYFLNVATGNLTKVSNLIKKGLATVSMESKFVKAIKKYLADVRFDLILYATPPITLVKAISFVKKRDNAKTYLLLKDIFPQNAVDMGMMAQSGVKGLIYRYFRKKEKKLYELSDRIGCMSRANVEYILKNNPQLDPAKVEISPNSVQLLDMSVPEQERASLREKYTIPQDKKVFVYGGNLGRPQGVPFLIKCLETQLEKTDRYFLVVGDGTEYAVLDEWFAAHAPKNMKLLQRLPKEDYDRMVGACDIGMIFLDHRFTIPNFPSRLLSYMQAKIPVLCCTDPNTDVGDVCVSGGFGWFCESNDAAQFAALAETVMKADTKQMGLAGYAYLEKHYTTETSYQIITQ